MLTEEASKFTFFTNGASDVEIARKIHSLGYNAVADNAEAFIRSAVVASEIRESIISENLNL